MPSYPLVIYFNLGVFSVLHSARGEELSSDRTDHVL